MNVVDANVLIYAVNSSAEHHADSRRWLDGALSGNDTVGFSWISLLAFVRLSTKVGLFPAPLTIDAATEQVRAWLSAPSAVMVEPTPRHFEVWSGLLAAVGTGGNLVNDGHLAALAIEHRAQVRTYDSDFGRFPGVGWAAPPSA